MCSSTGQAAVVLNVGMMLNCCLFSEFCCVPGHGLSLGFRACGSASGLAATVHRLTPFCRASDAALPYSLCPTPKACRVSDSSYVGYYFGEYMIVGYLDP